MLRHCRNRPRLLRDKLAWSPWTWVIPRARFRWRRRALKRLRLQARLARSERLSAVSWRHLHAAHNLAAGCREWSSGGGWDGRSCGLFRAARTVIVSMALRAWAAVSKDGRSAGEYSRGL